MQDLLSLKPDIEMTDLGGYGEAMFIAPGTQAFADEQSL